MFHNKITLGLMLNRWRIHYNITDGESRKGCNVEQCCHNHLIYRYTVRRIVLPDQGVIRRAAWFKKTVPLYRIFLSVDNAFHYYN